MDKVLQRDVLGLRHVRQLSEQRPALGRYHNHDGAEVDVVIEEADGTIVAIEVKASSCVSDHDLRGLRYLRAKLGERFTAGVVLSTGERSYTAEDRIHVTPIESLWH